MKTEKINTKTNFRGFYRIANTPKNAKIINEYILPKTKLIDYPIWTNSNSSPISQSIMKYLSIFAKDNGGSTNWLRNNARRYGVELPIDDHKTLIVVSGTKDISKVNNFELKMSIKTALHTLKTYTKMFFGIKSDVHIPGEPAYIEDLRMFSELHNKCTNQYNKFLEKNNVVNIEHVGDLLNSLANEIEAKI